MIRVGFGYDVHRLEPMKSLVIGGVSIPHSKGAVGHSDADVLIHAICDALLGAAGLEDIGHYFPDTDPQWKNIDSTILLKKVVAILKERGFSVNNIDSTVVLQEPKIAPYLLKMKDILAACVEVDSTRISIKATTTEHLGFEGKQEGIAAYAVATIYQSEVP